MTKYFFVPMVCIVAIAILILVFSLYQQTDIQPAAFKAVIVEGGPGIGDYEFFVSMVDSDQRNGPSNGHLYLRIMDSNQTMLYSSDTLVRSYNFSTYTNYTGGVPTIGYRWTVPLGNVTSGVPFPGNMGIAEILFLSLNGGYISTTVYLQIPVLT